MKSVFITGATTNTGLGIAHKFAKEGYAVFIGSRSGEQATETAEMLKEKYGVFSKGYDMIVGDEDNVNEIFDDINNLGYPVDAVVLNAANLGICQEFLTVDMKDFTDVINTNMLELYDYTCRRKADDKKRRWLGGFCKLKHRIPCNP